MDWLLHLFGQGKDLTAIQMSMRGITAFALALFQDQAPSLFPEYQNFYPFLIGNIYLSTSSQGECLLWLGRIV
ncbi:hypothetical protein A3860_12640 [Niastella vici]|uniref:Uncharacterized protein n=1 Tax=Niastella vici TaxID=1703345 RepID=A0A1V9G6R9_9BACT|nr:hypothetical protein [Niastella vici]OQP66345.1 hypothetical protein A3860_12640 [Niastella vici]